MASEPPAEIFMGSNINARKPHPPIALHVKLPMRGSLPENLHHTKMSLYTVALCYVALTRHLIEVWFLFSVVIRVL